jgi:hypothetical protein
VALVTSTEKLQQVLLARLAGEADDGSLPALLEESFGDNPSLAPLVAAMRRRAEEDAAQAAENEADPAVGETLDLLYTEVEELRLRNRTVAAALGACPRCWGEAADCPTCRGRGRPGGRSPDPVLYHELVEPAVRRRTRQERALTLSQPGP